MKLLEKDDLNKKAENLKLMKLQNKKQKKTNNKFETKKTKKCKNKTIYKTGYDVRIDDTEIEKYEFHQHENPISINNVGINEIFVFNKAPFGKQDLGYLIGYKRCYKN